MVSTGSTDEGTGSSAQGTGSPDQGSGPTESAAASTVGPPERAGRYQRSPSAMVGALVVTLLVILGFVAFRALNRSDLEVKPERIDYLSQVRYAQQDGGRTDLVYPAHLPTGWYATNVTFSTGGAAEIELSMLTADDQYVGLVQSPASVPELLTTYVDSHPDSGSPVRVPGSVVSNWDTWTDSGGDTALVAEHGQDSLLVFGTVSRDRLEQLAATLTTRPVGKRASGR